MKERTERACSRCHKVKRISEFEGVKNKPPSVCYSCWERARKAGSRHQDHGNTFKTLYKVSLVLTICYEIAVVLFHNNQLARSRNVIQQIGVSNMMNSEVVTGLVIGGGITLLFYVLSKSS